MGRVKRYVKRIQIGVTEKLDSVLRELIGERQTPYQYFIEELLYKSYEEKQNKRGRPKSQSLINYSNSNLNPNDLGTLPDGTPITQEMIDNDRQAEEQYEEEQEKLRQSYEKKEEDEKKKKESLKETYAFKFRTSTVLKKKVWGKIGVVAPHLVDDYSKDKNVRILRTAKDMEEAKKELNDIQEFVVKKQLELDKKHGKNRNSPEWILAWEKIDPT